MPVISGHPENALAFLLFMITGCAKVSVTPLAPDGRASGEAEGLRYFLPKPYLLVMNLSGSSATDGASPAPGAVVDPKTGKPVGPPAAPGAGDSSSGQTGGPTGSTAPAATGETSFLAADSRIVAKLIYLPDYSHPMAVTESPGLFGAVSMNASLQDSWMLSSLQGSGDSKTAETLASLASLVSSNGGAVTGAGAAKPAVRPPGGAGGAVSAAPQLLPPRLYSLVYDPNGTLVDVCLVRAFDSEMNVVPRCSPGSIVSRSPSAR
jgi:hypothetical protein